MKNIGKVLFIVSSLLLVAWGTDMIIARYNYNKQCKSYWNLATKASSIPQKSIYIDKFVSSLESYDLYGQYNAIILKTPDNSFDENLKALHSLQTRLHEIQKMDVSSFEYQTAIQQITAQEQDEANDMISTFWDIWLKDHNILLWDWFAAIFLMIIPACIIAGAKMWADN